MAIFAHSGCIGEGPSSSTSRNAYGESLTKCAFAAGDSPRKKIITCNSKDQDRFDGISPGSEGNSARAETKRSRIHLTTSDESAGDGDPISSRSDEHISGITPICKKRRMSARSYRALLKSNNTTSTLHLENQLQSQCSTCSILPRDGVSQLSVICSCKVDVGQTEEGSPDTEDERWSGGRYRSLSHLNDSSGAIQRNDSHTVCVVCNQSGSLLCCGGKGCNSAYHLACLDPPLNETPLGQWLCFCCLRKKMEFGVYSVSEGVESIWDFREEMQEIHYLVKYKGIAHAHNRWIPDSWLLPEDSMILAKFKKHRKEQVKKWNEEWMQPHRLLKKRVLIPPERINECSCGHGDNYEYCYIEWFVKWKGLGYEHATWEFEKAPFLCSAEGKALIDDYERRRDQAKKVSDHSRNGKAEYIKKKPFDNLSRLLDGCLFEHDNSHVESVRRILKCWYRNQNAVIIDDQERIFKSIMFLLSLTPYTCQPFLIISKTSCLSTWEAEFVRLAPSISSVVYSGNRHIRKRIQSLEFYEAGGCIMFQVLLASPNDIVEDLEAFDCIGWEAVIIDDCQKSGVSKHLGQLSNLASAFRLLLLNSLPKDNIVNYLNVLTFLDPRRQERPVSLKLDAIDSNDEFSILRERLRQYLVEEHTQNSSVFVEYWVPVQLSEVQLIQYCDIILSNSHLLRSRLREDCFPSLLDVIVSLRKCCDHPYLVDDSMQLSVTKSRSVHECLDFGVNASGKLQLLDKILQETKNCGIKVLILFQSYVSAGRNSMGDILCDFLHQRFGEESFAYVDGRVDVSHRDIQDSVKCFNDMGSERFVIVIEKRACHSTIKLSSVDAVIVYDNDWNLSNDHKAFRKLTVDSPLHMVKFFRLYSPYTVEEKVLLLAKEAGGFDVTIEKTSTRFRHSLLSWGAMYLFSKLNEFCKFDISNTSPKSFSDNVLVNDMIGILTQSPKDVDITGPRSCSNIAKIHQSGASYSSNISLYGEKDELSSSYGDPTLFWSKLLQKRPPEFKSTSKQSSRIRGRNEYTKSPQTDSFKLQKGRRFGSYTTESISHETWSQCGPEAGGLGETSVPEHINLSNQPTLIHPTAFADDINDEKSEVDSFMSELVEAESLRDTQKKLHDLLKPELVQLCETLNFPENVRCTAEMFLEYVLENYTVCRAQKRILQAFILSLCLHASSFSEHDINYRESLESAKKYFNFVCTEKLVEAVHKKLKFLKYKFSSLVCVSTDFGELNSLENQLHEPRSKGAEVLMCSGNSEMADDHDIELGEIKEHPFCTSRIDDTCMKKVEKTARDENQSDFPKDRTAGSTNSSLPCIQEIVEEGRTSITRNGVPQELLQERSAEVTDHQDLEQGGRQSCVPSIDVTEYLMSNASSQTSKIRYDSDVHGSPEKPSLEQIQSLSDKILKERIELIDLVCSARLDKLLSKQSQEVIEFKTQIYDQKQHLLRNHGFGLETIRAANIDFDVCNNMKKLHEEFVKEMNRFNQHRKGQRNKLSNMQIGAIDNEKKIKDQWLEKAKLGSLVESFDMLPISVTGFKLENFNFQDQIEAYDKSLNFGSSLDATKSAGSIELGIPSMYHSNLAEEESPASQSRSVNALEPAEPSITSLDIAEYVQCARIADNPMETGALVSQYEIMNVTGDHDNISGPSAQHTECSESDGACLTSTLPSQISFASYSQASDCAGCENSAPHVQVSLVIEIENHVASGTEKEPDCSHHHDIVIPVSNGDTELIPLEHCNKFPESSDPVLQQLPPTDLTSDVPSNESVEVQAGRGGQPSNRSHCVVQLDGVSRSAPTVATSTKIWPANNSFSDSVILPVTGISDVADRNIQNHHHMTSNIQPETDNSPRVLSAVQQHMHEEGHDSDPLLYEMIGLRKEEHSLTQDCEKRKLELQIECDKELEKVRNKYASLIQAVEDEDTQKLKVNKKRQGLIQMNHNLAENFRGYFIENKRRTSAISQGEPSSSAQQLNQSPRPEIAQTRCWASPPTPGPSPLYYPRGQHNSSSIATPPPTRPIYSNVAFSNNSIRHHPTHQSNVNPLARMEPRAPAPHLRPFR